MSRIAVIVKGYPRLSETFIAQEIYGLEQRGVQQLIVALRQPYDPYQHEVHSKIQSDVLYLTEYLRDDPERVKRAMDWAQTQPTYSLARSMFETDLRYKRNSERFRRWGQACVLAHELPEDVIWLHSHYLHSPCTVTRYAAVLSGRHWSFSAHAKDIWTTPKRELRDKLAEAVWGVTCTQANLDYLQGLAEDPGKLHLVYHGLDFQGFPETPPPATLNNGEQDSPVLITSVGRLVEKKGYDLLLKALARLPDTLNWRFVHIGGGELSDVLQAQAQALGLQERVQWLGPQPRSKVLKVLKEADIFALACRISKSGDRDGLPNVLMEAQAMALPCLSTRISGVPEIIRDRSTGLLCSPQDVAGLSAALEQLIRDPDLRRNLGQSGFAEVRAKFAAQPGLDFLADQFSKCLEPCP